MTDAVFLIYGFIVITIFQVVGFVLGAVGCSKKSAERKYAVWGLILNAPCLMIVLLIAIKPFIMKQAKYIPNKQEIEAKYPEFLIQPVDIEGIEAYKGKGSPVFLFKYKTNTPNFIEQLERQTLAKGWTKLQNEKSTQVFLKETHSKKKNINFFEYDHVKVLHDSTSGKTCVGLAEIVGFEKIPDINQAPDTRILDRIFWNKLNSCMTSQ